jgi:very-short-patch-repair endonuclease
MDRGRLRARHLRRNPTNVERLLWQRLRFWQVEGYKFRRQQPLGKYIVDFVCLKRRLIIELDGGQHAENSQYDKERDVWLRDQGFVVLRLWNNEVLSNIDGVIQVIVKELQSTPLPQSFPAGDCVTVRTAV